MAVLEVTTVPYGMGDLELLPRGDWRVACYCGYKTPSYGIGGSRETADQRREAKGDAVRAWQAHVTADHKSDSSKNWADWLLVIMSGLSDRPAAHFSWSVKLYR